jgi:dihydrolipoamide dehydrogenase
MVMEQFDLIVIGGGPAGYTGAIRAAQLGLKVVCVEKDKTLGGTCLNVGCIPSKALLESSEHFDIANKKFAKHGIEVSGIKANIPQMITRKNEIVKQLTQGIAGLFKKNKIEWAQGNGKFTGTDGDQKIVEVEGPAGKRTLKAAKVLICTGSAVIELPNLKFDGKTVISNVEALDLQSVPGHLVVVGGGVIGLELGSVWKRLGAKVTIVEFMDSLLSMMDQQIAKEAYKSFVKQGLEFKLNTQAMSAKKVGDKMQLEVEDRATQAKETIDCDIILVSTGRKPYTDHLGLDKIGVTIGTEGADRGRIPINDHFETSAKGVYAVGDVVKGLMLAHKAEEEAVAAVEIMAGQSGHVNYNTIPNIIYTWPEIATVGLNEEELKKKGVEYKSGVFPFLANARARTMDDAEGMVKILADAKTDRVLGVHIFGPRASDLIAEAVSVMEFGGSAEDIARTCHAHPTLSEALKEAALDVAKRRINL